MKGGYTGYGYVPTRRYFIVRTIVRVVLWLIVAVALASVLPYWWRW